MFLLHGFAFALFQQSFTLCFTSVRRERITASGGEVARLNTGGGAQVHPF